MKNSILTVLAVSLMSSTLWAQTLAPATSEDLNEFDQQLSQAQSPADSADKRSAHEPKKSGGTKDNFGAVVSEEAKSLKDADAAQKKKMGEWVREQKRKSDEKSGTSLQNKGSDNSGTSGKDARTSQDANKGRRR